MPDIPFAVLERWSHVHWFQDDEPTWDLVWATRAHYLVRMQDGYQAAMDAWWMDTGSWWSL